MKFAKVLSFLLNLIFFFSFELFAKGMKNQITFRANEVIFDEKKQIFYLRGKVQIRFKAYLISCSEASVFLDESRVLAKGEVLFDFKDKTFRAQELDFNYSTLLGTLYKAELKWNKVYIYGEEIQKKEENIYLIKKGQYTSCSNCPPFLSFSSSSLRLDLDRGVVIKNALLKSFDKPIFYFPYFFFPLDPEESEAFKHKSRFLFPRIDFTELGFVFSQDLLIDLSKTQDLILTGRYYSERGLKLGFNHLYQPQGKNYGKIEGALIRDRGFHSSFPASRQEKNLRGYFKYSHYYVLPFEWIQRLEINHMTDLHYNKDYPDELSFHGEGALENRLSITKNFKNHHISAEMGFYTNLLKANPFSKNEDAVHRWPEINYSFLEKEIGNTGFSYKFDLNYVHFFRPESSYDDVFFSENKGQHIAGDKDGVFHYEVNEEEVILMDQIRTGQRLYFHPKLFHFMSLFDKVNMKSLLAYKDIFYRFHPSSKAAKRAGYKRNARQQSVNIEIASQMNFYRFFYLREDKYKHEVRPEISYENTPWFQLSDHPFFGNFETLPLSQAFVPVSDRDFLSRNKRIQFDYRDRIYNHQILKFSLKHRLIQKKEEKKNMTYKEIFTWTTEQAFDINNYKQIKSQPWSPLRNIFQLSLDRLRFQQVWDYFYYSKVSTIDSRIYIEDFRQRFLQFSYEKAFVIKEDNTYNEKERTENLRSGIGFKSRYLDLFGELTHSLVTQKLQRWSYLAILKFPGDCFSLYFQQTKEIGVKDPYFKLKLNYKI